MQHPVAQRAAARLRTIRSQWGALLAAVETPARPPSGWLPHHSTNFLNSGPVEADTTVVADRAPLALREHPAPANLDALDAAKTVERSVFALADTLATAVQQAAVGDPRRWRCRVPGAANARDAAGSRAHGLQWATVFIEARVLGEDTEPEWLDTHTLVAAPFSVLPEHLLHEAARVTRMCEQRIARVFHRDQLGASGAPSQYTAEAEQRAEAAEQQLADIRTPKPVGHGHPLYDLLDAMIGPGIDQDTARGLVGDYFRAITRTEEPTP